MEIFFNIGHMIKRFKNLLLASAFITLYASNTQAQDHPPFWSDVQVIKSYDKIYPVPAKPIVFIGSSSIRLWVDFQQAFPGYPVLNRGIGGAVTSDVDRYLEDILFPYHPKQVVIYVGENDLLKAPDANTVFADFKKLYSHLRSQLPNTPVLYIAIKGSPSRKQYQEKAKAANALIGTFIKNEKNIRFIDVYQPMLNKKGDMQPALFKEDMLHMNGTGYQIWNKLIISKLLK